MPLLFPAFITCYFQLDPDDRDPIRDVILELESSAQAARLTLAPASRRGSVGTSPANGSALPVN